MVSTKETKAVKSFPEIVLFYSEFFCEWKPLSKRGDQFLKKNFFAPSRNCFLCFSHFLANPGCQNNFSVKRKRILSTISSFRLVQTDFLSSG